MDLMTKVMTFSRILKDNKKVSEWFENRILDIKLHVKSFKLKQFLLDPAFY